MSDSKALSPETRQALWESFDTHPPLCYSSQVISPAGHICRHAPTGANQPQSASRGGSCPSRVIFDSLLQAVSCRRSLSGRDL